MSLHDRSQPEEIEARHIDRCLKADPAQGEAVAKALGIASIDIPK